MARISPALRPAVRFAGSVLVVSGLLLISDGVATLAWQEPVSSFIAQRHQAQLKTALANPPKRVVERKPLPGDAIARIEIPSIGIDEYVVEGTDTDHLRRGPGHYSETPLPGERGTSAIAGHRTTYGAPFRNIDQLKRSQAIYVETPTRRYTYAVTANRIVDDQDLSVLDDVGHRQLILSACHPLYSAAQRVVVFARQVAAEKL